MRSRCCLPLLALVLMLGCGGNDHNNVTPPPSTQIEITISPQSAASRVNQVTSFTASVTGTSSTAVTWSVQESNGGSMVDSNYLAPWKVGTYHVVATSVADPTKSASAAVDVSAKFAFIQDYPSGSVQPYSVTPMLGTIKSDGTFAAANVIDSGTGNPVSGAMDDVFLSADGKKATFRMHVPYGTSGGYSSEVFIANTDGTGQPRQLTPSETGYNFGPQFSPNAKQVIYVNEDCNDLMTVNADGSNMHTILPGCDSNRVGTTPSRYPTFSPDGQMIAAEVVQWDEANTTWWDGIATFNADGTNLVQLTKGTGVSSNPMCWDEMPTFTNDGNKIAFSRFCVDTSTYSIMTEALLTMNRDGTNETVIVQDASGAVIYCDPLAVADKILFSSNKDNPATDAFDIYSVPVSGGNITRLTNNNLYDGFNLSWWAGPPGATAQRVSIRKQFEKRIGKARSIMQRRRVH